MQVYMTPENERRNEKKKCEMWNTQEHTLQTTTEMKRMQPN